jgi:hypothetical protein
MQSTISLGMSWISTQFTSRYFHHYMKAPPLEERRFAFGCGATTKHTQRHGKHVKYD